MYFFSTRRPFITVLLINMVGICHFQSLKQTSCEKGNNEGLMNLSTNSCFQNCVQLTVPKADFIFLFEKWKVDMPQSHKDNAHCQTSTTHGLHKATWDGEMSPLGLKRETCPSAGVVSQGPYLSPPRLSPNCSQGTKAASEETSPPRARWSAFRAPWPLQPLPSLTGLRVL